MDIIKAIFGVGLVLAVCSLAFLGRDWDGETRLRAAAALSGTEYRPSLYQAPDVQPRLDQGMTSTASRSDTPPEPLLIVDTEALNLRAGPSTASAVLRALPRGTAVAEGVRNGNWVEVRTEDGTVGWMSVRYLREPANDAGL
ncbi:MAG: SH3 domain-containing protein [Bauldia sp.]|nr:SH3 domain-containing protein [Bauldia sp.]MCW5717879.1 SH3 domain-containing protein [Bauldia sp.]